ncbi:hypothetical protein [Streptomyces sp. NPDC014734]|uniref:hypothetical protein n=1 Tax=Streptomyces sp. NPDC014734 TaxID=3364886 RepID=UPI0036FCB6E7
MAVSSYTYTSEPGDWIGDGGSGTSNTVSVNSVADEPDPGKIVLSSNSWNMVFTAPQGESLRPGLYRDAERPPAGGRAPGMDIDRAHRGCSEVFGQFAIDQIEFDASGRLALLDLTFTQLCDSADAPALTGEIKYEVFPLSYAYESEDGDYIGGGTSNRYTGSTSLFQLTGSTDGIVAYTGSGKRDGWSVRFAAPEGERLQAGRTYRTTDLTDRTTAFLEVSHESRGCGNQTGELTITKMATDEQGKVTALAATFLQRCGGATAALRGTVHYYA